MHTTTITAPAFRSVEDVQSRNAASGAFYFSAATMRVHGSRVHSELFGGRLLVTSEGIPTGTSWPRFSGRDYSVILADDAARIHPLVREIPTRAAAHALARALAPYADALAAIVSTDAAGSSDLATAVADLIALGARPQVEDVEGLPALAGDFWRMVRAGHAPRDAVALLLVAARTC